MKRIVKRTALAGMIGAVMITAGHVTGLDAGLTRHVYNAMKQELADYSLAQTLSPRPCPRNAFVIVAIGQSNAANLIFGMTKADPDLPAYSYFYGRCFAIKDPLPGASGKMGSLWTSLAQRLARQSGRPIVVIAGGAAGASVTDWIQDTAGIFSRIIGRTRQAISQGLQPDLVLWHQGEADAQTSMPTAQYRDQLGELITRFQSTLAEHSSRSTPPKRAHWLIFLASRCRPTSTINSQIRSAQIAATMNDDAVSVGPDTDRLGDEYRYDGCHFNAKGRELILTDLMSTLAKLNLPHPASSEADGSK